MRETDRKQLYLFCASLYVKLISEATTVAMCLSLYNPWEAVAFLNASRQKQLPLFYVHSIRM